MTGPGPDDVAADDGHDLEAPGDRSGQPAGLRLELADAEQVPAKPERIGHQQHDPLTVEEDEREVVGDEVADRDRDQTGQEGPDTDDPGDGQGQPDDDREPAEQEDGLLADRRQPEPLVVRLGLRQAIEQDRTGRQGSQGQAGQLGPGLEQAGRERSDPHPVRASRRPGGVGPRIGSLPGVRGEPGERGQPTDETEPDREDLAVPAPRLASELGHRDERDHGVGDEHEAQDSTAPGRRHCELHPDDDDERDHGRPATEPSRVRPRLPAVDARPTQDRGSQPVEGRERIQPEPDRSDERGDQGESDPAVGPQEQRCRVSLGPPADRDLDDDQRPGDGADRDQGAPDDLWDPDDPLGRRLDRDDDRTSTADEDDGERGADGKGGRGEVGSEWDRRREPAGELVSGGSGRRGQGEEPGHQDQPDPGGRAPTGSAAPGGSGSSHVRRV